MGRYAKTLSEILKLNDTKDISLPNYLAMVFNASRALIDSPRAATKSVEFLENSIKPAELDAK
jgi:hypothetical protein